MTEPLAELSDAVAWYVEGDGPDRHAPTRATKARPTTKHEGAIEVYPAWVRLGGDLGIPTWVPRERVVEVHER